MIAPPTHYISSTHSIDGCIIATVFKGVQDAVQKLQLLASQKGNNLSGKAVSSEPSL